MADSDLQRRVEGGGGCVRGKSELSEAIIGRKRGEGWKDKKNTPLVITYKTAETYSQ